MMTMGGKTLKESSEYLIKDFLVKFGGEGGLVAVDKEGNVSMPFNSKGMYRGYMRSNQDFKVLIFEDE